MKYGAIEVPWTTAWSGEERFELRPCRWAEGKISMWQPHRPGEGKPTFAKPHMVRQRRAVAQRLCDLCGEPLGEDMVSLSFESHRLVEGRVMLLVVEPLSHRRCAAISMTQCPHLKRCVAAGTLWIREVFARPRIIAQLLTGEATEEFAGAYRPGTVGHLKMHIEAWNDRDIPWLEAA
jgi:hypothetical protein